MEKREEKREKKTWKELRMLGRKSTKVEGGIAYATPTFFPSAVIVRLSVG